MDWKEYSTKKLSDQIELLAWSSWLEVVARPFFSPQRPGVLKMVRRVPTRPYMNLIRIIRKNSGAAGSCYLGYISFHCVIHLLFYLTNYKRSVHAKSSSATETTEGKCPNFCHAIWRAKILPNAHAWNPNSKIRWEVLSSMFCFMFGLFRVRQFCILVVAEFGRVFKLCINR